MHVFIMNFCPEHQNQYMFSMILSSVKTYLKAFITEENQRYADIQEKNKKRSAEKMKNRKLNILTGNKI